MGVQDEDVFVCQWILRLHLGMGRAGIGPNGNQDEKE